MRHDPALLDALRRRPQIAFAGNAFRATRAKQHPLLASTRGGRWAPNNGPEILYTSLEREGALAEITHHWGQLTPMPTQPVALHRLSVGTAKTLRLIRADLSSLGVQDDLYKTSNYARTQDIGAAVAFLGCDGLIAPNARWNCENLMIFTENVPEDRVYTVVETEFVDWIAWARGRSLILS